MKNIYIFVKKLIDMKTEILSTEEKKAIDWDKPQWVIYKDIIVLSNGVHSGFYFTGTCLPCEFYPKGEFSKGWDKKCFQPIPESGLTIKISNND